ncbi:MAG: carbohydrate ABC transporter permease [Candidatus Rokubacteria bacterium]|nr:carbohydrate ABC transporter permease [Candidatus Rokubacteria bacterium]
MVLLRQLVSRKLAAALELAFAHVVLVAVVAPFFFVFFYMFWNSVKPDYLFFEPGVWRFPPTLDSYRAVFRETDILANIKNSVIVSSVATLVGLACGLMTAYAIARYHLRRLAMAILVTRMIPYITALIPFWMMYRWLGLINSYTGLVLAHLVITIPFGVWILMGFVEDIPRELEEAALIDGASRVQTFWRVIVPLVVPGIVAAAILCFIFSWNNFQLALVLGGVDVNTAPVAVFKFAAAEGGSRGQMMAAATLVTIPVFGIVLFIQKQMTAGLTVGGVSK